MQSQAEVIWLRWGLSEVVRSPEQLPPTDLSVIHLVKMWHTAGGLCLWSISANKKQPSLSGLSCPPACSLVSAVSSCLKGAGNCTALSDAPQMAFPYKPQWDRKGKDTPGLQSSCISLQHLKKNPIWSENGYMFTKHHWPFSILEVGVWTQAGDNRGSVCVVSNTPVFILDPDWVYGRDALEGVNVVTLLWTLRSPQTTTQELHATALLLETPRRLCRGVGRTLIL